MEIIEVKQNWPNDYFKIDLYVGNICNFQCWYCWPGCHEGNIKWPNYDLLVKNFSHLLNYYMEHTNKKNFQISLLGGEVTHWPKFIDFIKHFKENYNCVFSMHTNGSKKLDWWKKASSYVDLVSISHHPEFSKVKHNRELADYLYSQNVMVNIQVMMDSKHWNDCIEAVEYYKNSKYKWTIRHAEIIHNDINYTNAQKEILKELRPRTTNPIFYLLNNKSPGSRVKVIDSAGKSHKIDDHKLVLDRLNNFRGWECNVGVDWLNIKAGGNIEGICGNKLYNQNTVYNIYDENFLENFQPNIIPAICNSDCWCTFETNMPKKKINNTKKVIPIHAI